MNISDRLKIGCLFVVYCNFSASYLRYRALYYWYLFCFLIVAFFGAVFVLFCSISTSMTMCFAFAGCCFPLC